MSKGEEGELVGVKKSVMAVCFCAEGVVGVGGVSFCCYFLAEDVFWDFFFRLQLTISSSELSWFLRIVEKSFLEGKRRKSGRSLYGSETKGSVSHGGGLSSYPFLG